MPAKPIYQTFLYDVEKFVSGQFINNDSDWEISHGAKIEPEQSCEHCRVVPNPLSSKQKIHVSRFIIASKDGKTALCLHCVLQASNNLFIDAKTQGK